MFYLRKPSGEYISNDGTYTVKGFGDRILETYEDNAPADTYDRYVSAGYVDMSDTYVSTTDVLDRYKKDADPAVQELLEDILMHSGDRMTQTVAKTVSEAVLTEAEEYLSCMEEDPDYGKYLAKEVKNLLPGAADLPKKDFVAACRHLIEMHRKMREKGNDSVLHLTSMKSVLEENGLSIKKVETPLFLADYEIKNCFEIHNPEREAAFSSYLDRKDPVKFPTRMLFHGTDNANVWSIMKEGLRISEYHANGHSFGHGLYFGTELSVSRRYSSRYIFVCEVYTGNIYTPDKRGTYVVNPDNIRDLLGMDIDTVSNGPGAVTIFHEDACVVRYLVEV